MTPGVRVALVDPMASGHHRSYAAATALAVAEGGGSAHLIGPEALTASLAGAPGIDATTSVPYEPGRGLAAERRKSRFLRSAFAIAAREGVDLVHVLYLDRFVLALAGVRNRASLPTVASLHWTYLARSVPQRWVNVPVRWLERALLAAQFEAGIRVMVHSPATAAELTQAFRTSRIDALPYPSEPLEHGPIDREASRAQLGLPHDARVLLAFGATRWDKGADLAAAALARLPEDVHLLVAGEVRDLDGDRLRSLAGPANERLHLHLSFVRDDQVADVFGASDVVVVPYRAPFAGQSGPLTIAAALGVPVVASDLPVLRETVQAYGLGATFRSEDVDAFADAVRGVLGSPPTPDTERYRRDHAPAAFGGALRASYAAALGGRG